MTPAESDEFVRNGFIVKRGLLSAEHCARCLDTAWRILGTKGLTQDPGTWKRTYARRGVVKIRDGIQQDPAVDAIANDANVQRVARELIGADVENLGVRGLYPTFPIPRRISRPYEAHIENHSVQLFVMYYLAAVGVRGAGLYVWPGSHHDVYATMERKFDYCPTPTFIEAYDRYNVLGPIEWTGAAGDVLFAHHRLMHSGSNNFSRRVRFAVLHDFLSRDYESLRLERGDTAQMWDYWSPGIRAAAQRLGPNPAPAIEPRRRASRALLIRGQELLRRLKGSARHAYLEPRS